MQYVDRGIGEEKPFTRDEVAGWADRVLRYCRKAGRGGTMEFGGRRWLFLTGA